MKGWNDGRGREFARLALFSRSSSVTHAMRNEMGRADETAL
jgi:hypothetical protein